MKNLSAGILFLFLAISIAIGQTVQWASKVIKYSSVFVDVNNPTRLTALEALGPPSIDPNTSTGTSCAWSPEFVYAFREDYIHLGYDKPMKVRQVAISETLGAGSITKVVLYDTQGEQHEIFSNSKPKAVGTKGRMFHIFIPLTNYEVASAKVFLKSWCTGELAQIDCVGLSDGTDTIKTNINLAPGNLTAYKIESLGSSINTEWAEVLPLISPDGKTLYFTRDHHPENMGKKKEQDIWISKLHEDGTWSKAVNMGEPLNNEGHNGLSSITPDGNTALVLNAYKENGNSKSGISLSHRKAGKWELPVSQKIKYTNLNQYTSLALSGSGKTMLQAIENKTGFGNLDLTVSFMKEDGSWTDPMNLGKDVNTAGSEATPFLASDNLTLYFSTDGRVGYGSSDMFVTRRLDSTWTRWSEPQNLGPVLNTPAWDAYYTIPASGEYTYFVSGNNSLGSTDIFRIGLPPSVRPKPVVLIRGQVLNAKTKAPIEAEIFYESLLSGEELGIATSDLKEGYTIVLPPGEEYGFMAKAPGYFTVSENIDLKTVGEYLEITRELLLAPIETGIPVRLNNLFFDTGKGDLRPESTQELERLLKMLNENATITIEIGGHTDDVGDDASNMELSQKRASAVQAYLVAHGISETRLAAKGFGETKPTVPNDSPAHRQFNRRVEFTILKK